MTTPASTAGPCQAWEPIWCTPLPTGAAAVTGYAVQAATEVLWNATQQRFGPCPVTLRPCRRECSTGGALQYPTPTRTTEGWINATCGACSDGCSCTDLEEALLPAPVYAVVEVKVDGQVLAPSAYRVDDQRLLVRVDGGQWPTCQELQLPDTAAGTWSVTADYGEPVPMLGRQAVGELAAEITRGCLGEDCRLPANVVSLARQGVSIQFPEATRLAERGYFGGLFITTFNPHHHTGRPAVYDVDRPAWRQTGT